MINFYSTETKSSDCLALVNAHKRGSQTYENML